MAEIKGSTNDQPTNDVPLAKTVSANGTEHTTSSGDTTNTEQSAQTISSNGSVVTYTDPHADVSLISLEGRVFKVQSFVLKAQRCAVEANQLITSPHATVPASAPPPLKPR